MKSFLIKYRHTLILIAIIALASFLRLFQLGSLPAILNRDEAALAYNAYLISQTGMDEHEVFMPVYFESFGDFKLPGYIYILAGIYRVFPSLAFNDFVVRLPSALAGAGLVFISYKLAKLLGGKQKCSESLGLFFAFLVSITPVLIWYSRGAWEANLALFYSVAAFYIVVKQFKNWQTRRRAWSWQNLIILAVLLVLAIFTYNSPLLILPFAILTLILCSGLKNYHFYFKPVLLMTAITIFGFLALIPLTAQKDGITIFNDPTVWHQFVEHRESFDNPILARTLGNQYVFYISNMIESLFASFSPNFLVLTGGEHPWHQLGHGFVHIYWSMLFFLYLGLFGQLVWFIFKSVVFIYQKIHRQKTNFSWRSFWPLMMVVICLAPAVITVDAPHATRSLTFFYFVVLMVWLTMTYLVQKFVAVSYWQKFMERNKKWLFISILIAILVIEGSTYIHRYFFVFPSDQSRYQAGLDLAIAKIEENLSNQNFLVVSQDGDNYIYILAAWYAELSSEIFFSTIERGPITVYGIRKGLTVGRYRFEIGPETWQENEGLLLYNSREEIWEIQQH
ncbi:MAG: hypothetical protein LBG64_00165 [Pseudomonadales bacterium]|jgi:4-amino-4-deoxy-L-arabinose transferase-like glycosyltransferase|nr:hypothetical protein [Pseudomonadales bacterium]